MLSIFFMLWCTERPVLTYIAFAPTSEVVKKTTAYMGTAMYVIRELEDALDDCVASDSTRNDDAVKALDEAVAFYTGSLEGSAGGSGSGVQFYALANKRCKNFSTCGTSGEALTGNSKVNHDIFEEFDRMQQNLSNGSCADARKNKEDIVMFSLNVSVHSMYVKTETMNSMA